VKDIFSRRGVKRIEEIWEQLPKKRRKPMRIEYDGARDLLYIRFAVGERKVAKTETIRPGVHADFDVNDRLMGIEVIDAKEAIGRTIEFDLSDQFQNRMAATG
jgi:uncharacterized protein YuzE